MELNHDNWRLYAAKHYTNVNCAGTKEFLEDLQRAHLAKNMIKKWQQGTKVNARLLLNHIIMFTNVFEIDAAKRMLMFSAGEGQGPAMKTLLLYLNFIAQGEMPGVKYDLKMAKVLKELSNEQQYRR